MKSTMKNTLTCNQYLINKEVVKLIMLIFQYIFTLSSQYGNRITFKWQTFIILG